MTCEVHFFCDLSTLADECFKLCELDLRLECALLEDIANETEKLLVFVVCVRTFGVRD